MIALLLGWSLFAGDLFVIQNIATERTRIYEKCEDRANCKNRMIAEIPMLVGMSEGDDRGRMKYRYRTWLGNATISSWKKFYQDRGGKYPPWYSPNLRMPPAPGSDLFEWMESKYMANSKQEARGAFGWYAAHIEPAADMGYQWIHGTFGWAEDGDYFMQRIHSDNQGAYLNFSSGCTRLENAAIAFLHYLLPAGTEIYRIYAKEALLDESRSDYSEAPQFWDFLLTKEDVNRSPQYSSDRAEVLSLGLPSDYYLDSGTYEVDQYPDPVSFKRIRERSGRGRGVRRSRSITFYQGDIYELGKSSFRGTYYVDSGQLSGYQHPQGKIMIGGNKRDYPSYVKMD